MGFFKLLKHMFSDTKGIKAGKTSEVDMRHHKRNAPAKQEGSLVSAEQPEARVLTMPEANLHGRQAPSKPCVECLRSTTACFSGPMKEDTRHPAPGMDDPGIQELQPADSAPRTPFQNSGGASMAFNSPCADGASAAQSLIIGKERTEHVLSCTSAPAEWRIASDVKPHVPINRMVSFKDLLKLQSYSFLSDVDCSKAQQAVDPESDFEEHQPQCSEYLRVVGGTDSTFLASHLLMSQMHVQDHDLHGTVFSRFHGWSAAYETEQHVHSQMPIDLLQRGHQRKSKESNVLAVSSALPRAMKRSTWSVNDYERSRKLNNGYASKVYSGICKASGLKVALKVYRLDKLCDQQRCQLFREINIHSKLQHRNIVQFHCAFMEENCVIIVQEFATGGDLSRLLYEMGGRLTEREAVKVVLQPLLCALQYLHTEGILHRDIKPENCLLAGAMVLQIADFGLAVDLREERADTRSGTLDYMAPEILRLPPKQTPDQYKTMPDAAHYDMAVDCWSVGVLAYELLCGKPPFAAQEMLDTARNIIKGEIYVPKELSPGAVDFIACCLEPNPANRITVIKMLSHPWAKMLERRKTFS